MSAPNRIALQVWIVEDDAPSFGPAGVVGIHLTEPCSDERPPGATVRRCLAVLAPLDIDAPASGEYGGDAT